MHTTYQKWELGHNEKYFGKLGLLWEGLRPIYLGSKKLWDQPFPPLFHSISLLSALNLIIPVDNYFCPGWRLWFLSQQTLSQSLAAGYSRAALGDEARVSIMWWRELEASSYHWPLLLVLSCLRQGGWGTRGWTGKMRNVMWSEVEKRKWVEDRREDKSNRNVLMGDKTSHSTTLSSSAANGCLATPSCCLQVAPSW